MGKPPKPRYKIIPAKANARKKPPLGGFQDIAEHWSACGAYLVGMNGLEPLTWQEIHSYNQASRSNLSGWTCRMIKTMSDVYCQEYAIAGKPEAVQPYVISPC